MKMKGSDLLEAGKKTGKETGDIAKEAFAKGKASGQKEKEKGKEAGKKTGKETGEIAKGAFEKGKASGQSEKEKGKEAGKNVSV